MSEWKPRSVGTQPFKKGTGNLLSKVKKILESENVKIVNNLKDSNGLVGFETKHFIVVAKGYIYGNIVSSHKTIVSIADEKEKDIAMYIGDNDCFYIFKTVDILRNGFENERKGRNKIKMLNWDIRYGKRLNKWKKITEKDLTHWSSS